MTKKDQMEKETKGWLQKVGSDLRPNSGSIFLDF